MFDRAVSAICRVACTLIVSAGPAAAYDCPADPATDSVYSNWPQTRDWADDTFNITHVGATDTRCGLALGTSESQTNGTGTLAELQASADRVQQTHHSQYIFTGKVKCITQRNRITFAATTVYKLERKTSSGQIQRANKAVDIWNNVADRTCTLPTNVARDVGACGPENTACTNPINVAVGNKYQREIDYVGTGTFPLRFERHYNSMSTTQRSLSMGWTSTYSRSIDAVASDVASVSRDDGKAFRYTRSAEGQPWTTYSDIVGTLTQLTGAAGDITGWTYLNSDDELETYDASGQLVAIRDRAGHSQVLAYSSYQLMSVTDADGRKLQFTYDTSGRIATMTDPVGGVYVYAYSGASAIADNLASVTYPGGATRQYLYGEAAYVSAIPNAGVSYKHTLTGVNDENGSRFAAWTFDASGRAVSSEHASGTSKYLVSYGLRSDVGSSAVVTDPLFSSRTYTYQRVGNVSKNTSVTGAACSNCGATASTYDVNGFLASRLDRNGNLTCYTNNTRGLETQRVEGLAGTACPGTTVPGITRTITTTWHPTFRLPDVITESGRTTDVDYDVNSNVTRKTVTSTADGSTRAWQWTYNSSGQVLTADGPRTDVPDVTTYTYNTCTTGAGCGQLATVTNALGQVTTYGAYDANGRPTSITDPNGVSTTLAYNFRGQVTSRTEAGETTSFAYDPVGQLTRVTLLDSSYLEYVYDAAHRMTEMRDNLGNKVVYTLDAMGNRTAENAYDPANALRRTHGRVYSTVNRLYQDVNAAGTAAVATTYGYDPNGNLTTTNAPLARNTTNAYDALNRLKQVTDPLSGSTQFAYDATDNLLSVTDPKGLVTGYQYNGFGDLKRLSSPDTGVTGYSHDSGGNLQTATDARNKTVTHSYDALNRLTHSAYTDQTIDYGYDAGTNGVGRLTSVTDASGSTSWSYTAQGRVSGRTQVMGTMTKAVGYTYDAAGRLQSMTLPSGAVVAYGYTAGRVSSVTVNGTPVASGVLYEPFGPTRGWNWGNGTIAARSYTLDGNIAQVDSNGLKTYALDDAFRITGITDSVDPNKTWSYGYDLLDRLTSATRTGLSQSWSYDANGNRLTEGGNTPSTFTISPTSNRVTTINGTLARSVGYDEAGNMTADSVRTMTYNAAGRMTSYVKGGVTTALTYNALGQRVTKTNISGTHYFVYDEAGHLIGEYDGSGALFQETVFLGDIPVAALWPAAGGGVTVTYVHTDHLNTPRAITRPSDNAVIWRWDSDAFGTTAANEDPDGDGIPLRYYPRFPGQFHDASSELHYNYFRDYDPQIGRYVQSDPIGLEGGINTYSYGLSSPVMSTDPKGQSAFGIIVPAAVIGGGIYCYRRGLRTCEVMYPKHRDREHPDFANFIECSNRMTIWAALIIGMSSDPVGTAVSTIGEEIGRQVCDSCETR